MAMDRGLENINASLFSYGVGINSDLLQDLVCNRIPIPAGGRMQLVPFHYFPLFTSKQLNHLICKNLGAVWTQFPATLRVKEKQGLKTTPLLVSSEYTRIANAPATVELMTVALTASDPNIRKVMNGGNKVSGVLIEGSFKSPFRYQRRFTSGKFMDQGNSAMVVIADGDIIRNFVSSKGGNYPTGYDRYSQITFANKKFLLNCVDYLIDDNGLIEIRGRETSLRLLDTVRIKEEKTYWQLINVILPIAGVILFGLTNYFIRSRRYKA